MGLWLRSDFIVAVTRGCKRYRRNHVKSPRSGWRTRCWTPGKRGSTVLLTGRDQEQNRRNRIGALPFSGLCQTVAISGNGELELKACWVQAASGQPDKICTDPLYLFACARLWHQRADAGAGWELVRGLKSAEPGARVAIALLAETKNSQLRVRELHHGLGGPGTPRRVD